MKNLMRKIVDMISPPPVPVTYIPPPPQWWVDYDGTVMYSGMDEAPMMEAVHAAEQTINYKLSEVDAMIAWLIKAGKGEIESVRLDAS